MIPNRFLFRVAYPCHFIDDLPREGGDDLLDLPESCRLDNFADMDERSNFADVRLAWNERGLALQVEVKGKEQAAVGDVSGPRQSDGVTLWVDTRDARTSHRASRFCHQFHFLAAGGGADKEEAIFAQSKIHRALEDAPLASAGEIAYQALHIKGGYRIEAFLPAAVLHGFDPEQNPRLGVFYAVRDQEHGEQTLAAGTDLPFAEDPSLWSVLELVRRE